MTYGGYGYGSAPYGSAAEAPAPGPLTLKPAVVELVTPLVPLINQQPIKPAVLDLAASPVGALQADDGYALEVLRDSPTIYWRLGESSGTTAEDSSGNGHDGTYQNAPTLGATGALAVGSDTAVTLNGTSHYIDIADNAAWDSATFSVEIWAKWTTTDAEKIVEREGAWSFNLNSGSAGAILFSGDNSGTKASFDGDYNDGQYHHIVGTYTGASGTISLYVDGSLVDSGSPTSSTVPNAADASGIRIGLTNPSNYFPGTVDEFAYYAGTALSAERVAAHYEAAGLGTVALKPAVLDLAAPVLEVPTSNVALRPAVVDLVAPTLPLINQIALRAAVLELRAVLISGAQSRTTTSVDDSVSGRLLLGGYVLVDAVPAIPTPPVTPTTIRRVSETYPNPTLVDGRPT